ncbi:DUF4253 domain-containing protein [Frankia sp. CNm7]|nr:DUF4253 domain-containing protein [Frankia nepalensis]MBL7514440.1 DUF4253 domain-containing protein [Frankia nepalensis]MBL7524837.1 DUF4253 domain-containing protein [Frankia nepalensis]
MSDEPATAELWAGLLAAHPTSGLWPLLLEPPHWDDKDRPPGEPAELRPWETGELAPDLMTAPGDHDPAALLAHWWKDCAEGWYAHDFYKPFGPTWPGLVAPPEPAADPGGAAAQCARQLLGESPAMRLGLVAAGSGADALTVAGWQGPLNHTNDTAEISAVVASWERRFGVRVVGVGFDTLYLSVAAPPASEDDALLLAAEHLAFCPDNVNSDISLRAYAHSLRNAGTWTFWWD